MAPSSTMALTMEERSLQLDSLHAKAELLVPQSPTGPLTQFFGSPLCSPSTSRLKSGKTAERLDVRMIVASALGSALPALSRRSSRRSSLERGECAAEGIKCSALMKAARAGKSRACWELTFGEEFDVSVLDASGYTALMYAAENGHVSAVVALLAMGAQVAVAGSHKARSALHCAAAAGQEECLRVLLDSLRGSEELLVQINLPDDTGCTPLDLASQLDVHSAGFLLLLKHGAEYSRATPSEVDERSQGATLAHARSSSSDWSASTSGSEWASTSDSPRTPHSRFLLSCPKKPQRLPPVSPTPSKSRKSVEMSHEPSCSSGDDKVAGSSDTSLPPIKLRGQSSPLAPGRRKSLPKLVKDEEDRPVMPEQRTPRRRHSSPGRGAQLSLWAPAVQHLISPKTPKTRKGLQSHERW